MGVDNLILDPETIERLREDKGRQVAVWLKDGVGECDAIAVAIRLRLVVVRNGYEHRDPYPYLVLWADENPRAIAFQLRRQPEVLEVYSDSGGVIRGPKASAPYTPSSHEL